MVFSPSKVKARYSHSNITKSVGYASV